MRPEQGTRDWGKAPEIRVRATEIWVRELEIGVGALEIRWGCWRPE